jgi:hypothetical protein
MSDFIENLRTAIDAKHAEAIRALQVLESYLNDAPSAMDVPQRSPASVARRQEPVGSIRERVLSIIASDWAGVPSMAKKLGLDGKQVRGVVLAPDLKDKIQRRESNGITEYRYEPEKNAQTQK